MTVEEVSFPSLLTRASAWDRLATKAAVPMPFAARPVVQAHVAHGLAPADLRCLAVRRGDDILALLPLDPRGSQIGWLRRASAPWMTPYVTASPLLVHRDEVETALDALLDALPRLGRLWLFPLLGIEDRVGSALREALARRGWASAVVAPFERAVLDRRESYEAYASVIGASRRKDLRRRRRRLDEAGAVAFQVATDRPGLGGAVESFLALEQDGWKGHQGTALASRPDTAAFARDLFGIGWGPVAPRADMLLLDGRPIAVSLSLVTSGTAFLLKSTYDEAMARFSPGVILEDAIVRDMHATAFADRLDSASLAGGLLDSLYPDRHSIGDLLFSADPQATPETVTGLALGEMRRRELLTFGKGLVRRLQGQG